jgi:hypothetical protein
MVFVDVTGSDDAAIVLAEKRLGIARTLIPPPHDAHGDFAGGRRLALAAEDAPRENGGQNHSGAGGLEKIAAIEGFHRGAAAGFIFHVFDVGFCRLLFDGRYFQIIRQ